VYSGTNDLLSVPAETLWHPDDCRR